MASDANNLISREKIRWGDKIKVYIRRNRKNNDVSPASTAAVDAATQATKGNDSNNDVLIGNFTSGKVPGGGDGGANLYNDVKPVITRVDDRVRISVTGSRVEEIRGVKRTFESELDLVRSVVKKLEAKEQLQLTSRDSGSGSGNNNGGNELDHVRSVIKKLEPKKQKFHLTLRGSGNNSGGDSNSSIVGVLGGRGIVSRNYPRYAGGDNVIDDRPLVRVNSEVGSMGHGHSPLRPFRPPGIAVAVNDNVGGEYVEREKRTPKANQYYKNSEFLLAKDRLPPESNKKLKTNGGGKNHRGGSKHVFGFDDKYSKQLFRSCTDLLGRLMKHKHGWVFNEPVNVKALGLHDYLDIIKRPMDLGTIKAKLSQNWYNSPKEFAEDIRLVFSNAKTYNPKGQDVHVMAEELSQIFEERWATIEARYNPDWRYQMYHDAGLPTPTSRNLGRPPNFVHEPVPYHALTHAPQARNLERSESITGAVDSRKKASSFSHVGKTPVPKKPKAKEPNKRDMTYEEKQKLSIKLENLPQEKLDAIIHIIKKRSGALNQNNEEIEVDIDSVDAETLWELDRFVTNYKKSLSKNKRKAEVALQARAAQSAPVTNSGPMVADALKESRTEGGNQADNASSSSSSSSSSSDSGSSSSDSDSDSSSSCGSGAGH
ncbi:unnamed protein product [Withania somnifera]